MTTLCTFVISLFLQKFMKVLRRRRTVCVFIMQYLAQSYIGMSTE